MQTFRPFGLGYLLFAAFSTAGAQTWTKLHKAALKEGGTVNFYGTLAQINAERILPVFEKRFPGLKVNHVDATADKLAARAITEARGGRVFADIFQMALENVLQVIEQKLASNSFRPKPRPIQQILRGPIWLAADMVIITASWNTNLVKKEDEPKQFDDFADPKWKGKVDWRTTGPGIVDSVWRGINSRTMRKPSTFSRDCRQQC